MKIIVPLILVVLIVSAFILYRSREHFTPKVDAKNVDKFILYYSPNCGHCHNFMPTWKKFSHSMKDDKTLQVFEVNCLADKDQCKDIMGYPTAKLIKKNGQVVEFKDKRTEESLSAFVKANRS
jgi:hypothetical protein